MRKLLLIGVLALTGCAGNPFVPEAKIVKVDKPIPFCPVPPIVPHCTNYVDTLTPEDVKDPGKVAQAYKLDMTCYRANDKTFRQILSGYEDVSRINHEVEVLFDGLGETYEQAIHPSVKTPPTTVEQP